MEKFFATTWLILLFSTGYSQQNYREIEINPFVRFDWYPKFSNTPNPVSTNKIKLKGTSPGLTVAIINYKLKHYLRYGLAYLRHAFNDIEQNNSVFGESSNRVIEGYTPPGGLTPGVVYTTDKYFYNNVGLQIGLGSFLYLKKSFKLTYGLDLSNYFSFSRMYHITAPPPNGANFKVSSFQYFSLMADARFTFSKTFGKNGLGGSCVLPLFQMWKQDSHFPGEKGSEWRSKGLGGVSLGIVLFRSLN